MQVVRPRNDYVAFRAEWPTAADIETACDIVDYNFIYFLVKKLLKAPQ